MQSMKFSMLIEKVIYIFIFRVYCNNEILEMFKNIERIIRLILHKYETNVMIQRDTAYD